MEKLLEISRKQERLIIGTMSGTSTDGIDLALVKISGSRLNTKLQVLAYTSIPYSDEVRDKIFRLYPPKLVSVDYIAYLSFELAEIHAEGINKFILDNGFRNDQVDLICLYGLTLFHGSPNKDKGLPGVHMQLVEPAIVMERTGITTIGDIRQQDIAAGGEGCPLSPYVDWVLFRNEELGRAVQNIGGIGNVTGLPPKANLDDLISFDTGPGNMVIDGLIKIFSGGKELYDRDGEMAAQATVHNELLNQLMSLPHILRKPPKSTGREDFGDQFCEWLVERAKSMSISQKDLVATATAFTAEAIADSYRRFLFPRFKVDEVILTGGGVRNPTLVNMIKEKVAPLKVLNHEDFGISNDAREAISWAILGNEIIQGKTCNVPTATGAVRPVLLGKILPGHQCIVSD